MRGVYLHRNGTVTLEVCESNDCACRRMVTFDNYYCASDLEISKKHNKESHNIDGTWTENTYEFLLLKIKRCRKALGHKNWLTALRNRINNRMSRWRNPR